MIGRRSAVTLAVSITTILPATVAQGHTAKWAALGPPPPPPHGQQAQCGTDFVPQNFNGPIISSVNGVVDVEKCCDSCANQKGIRWVLDIEDKQRKLLSEDGSALIGGSYMSGSVTPGYHPIR
eukprot:COSAG02_NODE_4257_length_5578_cov_1.529111_2_plen_123_part_00